MASRIQRSQSMMMGGTVYVPLTKERQEIIAAITAAGINARSLSIPGFNAERYIKLRAGGVGKVDAAIKAMGWEQSNPMRKTIGKYHLSRCKDFKRHKRGARHLSLCRDFNRKRKSRRRGRKARRSRALGRYSFPYRDPRSGVSRIAYFDSKGMRRKFASQTRRWISYVKAHS